MPEPAQDRERLARAVATLLGPDARGLELVELGGGSGHVSYRVSLAEQSYVLRVRHAPSAATLAPEEELALLKAAAAAGITPEPLRMDRATGALLLRYAPGAKGLAETAAREPANIARIAGLLRRLHAMPAMLRDYAPLRHAEHYFAAAARRASLTRREQEMAAELRTLASSYSARYPPCAVCHNDLVAANILDAGELLLIDFEYAARAAPILDLASLAAMNGYDENERGELLRAYYGSSAPPVTPAELTEVVRMVELMAYFWARALPPELGAQNARYLRVC